jgi:hypothetical protein
MLSTEFGAGSRPVFSLGVVDDELLGRDFVRWLRVGLSTDSADFERTEEILRHAYRLAGEESYFFVRVRSPREALLGLRRMGRIRSARSPSPGPVQRILGQRERVPTRIQPPWAFFLWYGLQNSVDHGFHQPVWRAAYRYVNGKADLPLLPRGTLGQTDVARVAYDRLSEELGRDAGGRESERLALREALAGTCGWVWELEHGRLCVISDRPTEIHTEETRLGVRIHRTDGPAVVFRDGFQVWAWHGVAVPRRVIETPDFLSVDEIRSEADPVVRQVMLERVGISRYLDLAGGQVVDSVCDDEGSVPAGLRGAALVKAPWWGGREGLAALSLVDARLEHRHWIRVPPDSATVREAVAWTFGLEAEEYVPEVEV